MVGKVKKIPQKKELYRGVKQKVDLSPQGPAGPRNKLIYVVSTDIVFLSFFYPGHFMFIQ